MRWSIAVAAVACLFLSGATVPVVRGIGWRCNATSTPFGDADAFGPGFGLFVGVVVGLVLLVVSDGALLLAEVASPDDL